MHKLFFLFIKLKKIEFSSVSVKCDTRKKPSFECEFRVSSVTLELETETRFFSSSDV